MVDKTSTSNAHIDSLYHLIGYIIERCPAACDDEMRIRFDGIIDTYKRFVRLEAEKDDNWPEPWQMIDEVHVGRNYLIAHTAVLQSFINSLRSDALKASNTDIRQKISALDQKIEVNFNNFFAEPFEYDRRNDF